MITNVYVDGFNLYYRALSRTKFKWLDLRRLSGILFPEDQIQRIYYFTARLRARPEDPFQSQRQDVYLRALRSLPSLSIEYGDFRRRTRRGPVVTPNPGPRKIVTIEDSEEKGSDVNLATRLLVDGFSGRYEQAIVISNDSDLVSPIRYVRRELNLTIGVVNPDYRGKTQRNLEAAATFVKRLRPKHLFQSQFPRSFSDRHGRITKPRNW